MALTAVLAVGKAPLEGKVKGHQGAGKAQVTFSLGDTVRDVEEATGSMISKSL